jgi:hypothetical protein
VSHTAPSSDARQSSVVVNPILAGILQQQRKSSAGIDASRRTAQPSSQVLISRPRSITTDTAGQATGHQALARQAVGKGIRHGFAVSAVQPAQPRSTQELDQSLSELASNYRRSFVQQQNSTASDAALAAAAAEAAAAADDLGSDSDPTPLSQMQQERDESFTGFLSRNSSLIDLAMIAPVDDEETSDVATSASNATNRFGFVDFPNPEVDPSGFRKS